MSHVGIYQIADLCLGKVSFKKHQLDDKFRSEGVCVGDFNRDGKPDIAAGSVWFAAPDWTRHNVLEKAEEFGTEILRLCVEVGGVLTGEHGVGVEKRDLMGEVFSEDDLNHQQRLKCAFDPEGLLNPGKVFPTLHRCAELGRLHVHGGRLPHPELERF